MRKIFAALGIFSVWLDSVELYMKDTESSEFRSILSKSANILGLEKTQNLTFDQFINRIEENSVELAMSKVQTTAIKYQGKAERAWGTPYIDTQTQQVQSPNGGKELESEIYFMLSPRLPWVSSMLRQIYKTRHLKEVKNYELLKTINIISLKRLYLDYLLQKEKVNIYLDRIQSAIDQLDVAQGRYEAGRISQAQYLFFKSDLLKVQTAMSDAKKDLEHTLNSLRVGLGIDSDWDLKISDLDFEYANTSSDEVALKAQDSLYLQIAALDVQNYAQSAKYVSRSRFDALDIGVGGVFSESNNGVGVKVKIPIPLTSKFDNEKKMYMTLESGAIIQREILKRQISKNAQSYLDQLEMKRNSIFMAQTNETNQQRLYDIARVGYEGGRTSVFEYLSIKNQYLEAAIMVVEEKRHYIETMSMLEETLAMIIINGDLDNGAKIMNLK